MEVQRVHKLGKVESKACWVQLILSKESFVLEVGNCASSPEREPQTTGRN